MAVTVCSLTEPSAYGQPDHLQPNRHQSSRYRCPGKRRRGRHSRSGSLEYRGGDQRIYPQPGFGQQGGGVAECGGSAVAVLVEGSFIGTDITGTTAIGKAFGGVYVGSGSLFTDKSPGSASGTTIRGTTTGAVYEVFALSRARRLVSRIEFCYTPKHSDWLNIAENELSSLTRQCEAGRRFGDPQALRAETSAWSSDVNSTQRGVDWQMKIDDARCKLASVYPKNKL